MVGAFREPSSGRRKKPIHSIFNSIPKPVDKVKNGYDYIIRENNKEGGSEMATSSIDHNFVVKDKRNAEQLISALITPNTEVVKPAKSVSGKEAITLLMKKWKNAE